MTVLPHLNIKATPILSVESPRSSKTKLLPRLNDINDSSDQKSFGLSHHLNKLSSLSSKRSSIPPPRAGTPKIKIVARSDEALKQVPHEKTPGINAHNAVWKPLVRELPDYDYLWEPLQREDMRHQYDFYVTPKRIIASRPDEPYKMTTMLETEERHYHNYRRVRAMQQRQWNKEHIQYTIYPYAGIAEREIYNKHIRSVLKEQMEEKFQADKSEQDMKNLASELVIKQDRQDLEEDRQKQNRRAKFQFQFTARNKELMENKREYDQWNRVHQWHVERVILADDPINWSKTMT